MITASPAPTTNHDHKEFSSVGGLGTPGAGGAPTYWRIDMDEEYQRVAANAIAHEAFCAGQAWQQAAAAQERPCVLWKPRLFRDGNQWCALFGENIQDGVVGFGDSPADAMWDFDRNWQAKLPTKVDDPYAVAYGWIQPMLMHLSATQPAPSVPASAAARDVLGPIAVEAVDGAPRPGEGRRPDPRRDRAPGPRSSSTGG